MLAIGNGAHSALCTLHEFSVYLPFCHVCYVQAFEIKIALASYHGGPKSRVRLRRAQKRNEENSTGFGRRIDARHEPEGQAKPHIMLGMLTALLLSGLRET